jgi:ornithine cyclodeaminase
MKIIELPAILAALDEDKVLASIEEGFRKLSAGQADLMAVGYLAFPQAEGDSHIKGGYVHGDDIFVVKMGNSFYRNAERGLPTSNGCMVVASATTGEVLAILHDQGRLTDIRTAMAGAIAARAIARKGSSVLGVVGAGMQAKLQAQQIARVLGIQTVRVWARNESRAAALAAELGGQAVSLAELCAQADVIVTTTPSTTPILTAELVRPGTRIVAVGADADGKQEIDVSLLARARIVVDSKPQCVDHGDTSWGVKAGVVDEASLIELGALLAKPVDFQDSEIVIADLTGTAVQDVQIAKAVWQHVKDKA